MKVAAFETIFFSLCIKREVEAVYQMKNGGWKLLSTATVVIQVGAWGRGLYSSMIKKSLHLLLAKGCGRGRTLLAGGHVIIGDQDVVGERTQ